MRRQQIQHMMSLIIAARYHLLPVQGLQTLRHEQSQVLRQMLRTHTRYASVFSDEYANVHDSSYPYASVHARVLAVLRSYVNDHASFQLGLPLFLDRIYACQRAQRDRGSIIKVKLM